MVNIAAYRVQNEVIRQENRNMTVCSRFIAKIVFASFVYSPSDHTFFENSKFSQKCLYRFCWNFTHILYRPCRVPYKRPHKTITSRSRDIDVCNLEQIWSARDLDIYWSNLFTFGAAHCWLSSDVNAENRNKIRQHLTKLWFRAISGISRSRDIICEFFWKFVHGFLLPFRAKPQIFIWIHRSVIAGQPYHSWHGITKARLQVPCTRLIYIILGSRPRIIWYSWRLVSTFFCSAWFCFRKPFMDIFCLRLWGGAI